MVAVNLYPFRKAAANPATPFEALVEEIDIGGPSLVRAAAKNFRDVFVVVDPVDYPRLLTALDGPPDLAFRFSLMLKAFAHTAAYEASIASWFADVETFPPRLLLSLERVSPLTYGENPHQRGAYYAEAGVRRHLLSRVEQLAGKELSYNNLADLEGARRVVREFALPAAVIVKHGNPCGVAVAGTVEEAYERALAADPVSAFGCVLDGREVVEHQLRLMQEALVALGDEPRYDPEAAR